MAIFQTHVGVHDRSFGVTFFHVTRLANCESEKAWAPEEGLDREDLKRTTVTPQEGWTVRGNSFREICYLILGPVARGDSSGAGRLQTGQARQARNASGKAGRL